MGETGQSSLWTSYYFRSMRCQVSAVVFGSEITIGELLVGVGTLALACVTWWLAHRTSQQVELTRESIEAIDRPFLVATTEKFDLTPTFEGGSSEPTGDEWVLYAKLENFGKGPAVFDGMSLRDPSGNELAAQSWTTDSILKEGESLDVGIPISEPAHEGTILKLRTYYRSASGVRYQTTHGLEVAKHDRVHRQTFQRSLAET
jgi:hypothetical protein